MTRFSISVIRRCLILLLLPALASSIDSYAATPLQVSTGINPANYLIKRVGADHVSVQVLLGPGQSHHTYEPTPRQITQLAKSKVYFSIGIPFENTLTRRFSSNFPDLKVVDLRKGIDLLPMEETQQPEGWTLTEDQQPEGWTLAENSQPEGLTLTEHVHEQGEPDPHLWLNPRNMMIVTKSIVDALARMDASHASVYAANAQAVLQDLQALDEEIQLQLAPHMGKTFYVFHPAFGYFADRYGLKQKAVEVGGKEPSARAIASLVDQARREKVRAILVQPQFSTSAAQTIARAIGGQVVTVDPLAEDYPRMMRSIAETIRKALTPP